MKTLFLIFSMLLFTNGIIAQNNEIYLLIRADDIGSFHSANVACLESYQNGIARSVELMPPCAWFPEAVKMLSENPGFDVGIHLTLTSEWSTVKWRPLTHCPSLVDKDGYFFPMVWKNDNFPPNSSISESDWKIEEVEQELRAQIEVSLKYLPHISHLSNHMGFTSLDPRLNELGEKLAKEYKLDTETNNLDYFQGWDRGTKPEKRIDKFCENLEKLTAGKYLFVDHPAKDSDEMKTVGHKGYENVGLDREWVTRVFTSEKVKQTIKNKGIKLISYNDLKDKK
ncbi:MAG TPA: polysaccharide deacetylase family protein [Draconibacterium sp.]|nr:polysaccharide deacetylase family protein [Draconibacterium sp.]